MLIHPVIHGATTGSTYRVAGSLARAIAAFHPFASSWRSTSSPAAGKAGRLVGVATMVDETERRVQWEVHLHAKTKSKNGLNRWRVGGFNRPLMSYDLSTWLNIYTLQKGLLMWRVRDAQNATNKAAIIGQTRGHSTLLLLPPPTPRREHSYHDFGSAGPLPNNRSINKRRADQCCYERSPSGADSKTDPYHSRPWRPAVVWVVDFVFIDDSTAAFGWSYRTKHWGETPCPKQLYTNWPRALARC
jgi:hypothetical protein